MLVTIFQASNLDSNFSVHWYKIVKIMELFEKVRDCFLLQEILIFLPFNDQLRVRLVNKDFQWEAEKILKTNSKLKLYLGQDKDLCNFLRHFGQQLSDSEPKLKPMSHLNIAAVATVMLSPPRTSLHNLTMLGAQFGEDIRLLTLYLPQVLEPWMISKVRVVLQSCVNLEKLQLESTWWCGDFLMVEHTHGITRKLPVFVNLRQLDIRQVSLSQIGFLNELLEASPNLEKIIVHVMESETGVPSATSDFLSRLNSLGVKQFAVELNVKNQNVLLKKLIEADLNLKEVQIHLKVSEPAENIDEFKKDLQVMLTNLTKAGKLSKIVIRLLGDGRIDLDLPTVMMGVTLLDLGTMGLVGSKFTCGTVIIPLCPGQLSQLRTLVVGALSMLPYKHNVFPSVQTLRVEDTPNLVGVIDPSTFVPETRLWSLQFPKLTSLDMYILPGSEAQLRPILLEMRNLQELKIQLGNGYNYDSIFIWDVFTGGIRPVMGISTPMDILVPPDHSDVQVTPRRDVASLQNLTNLKTLELATCSGDLHADVIFYAMIHLTATKKVERLEKLQFSFGGFDDFLSRFTNNKNSGMMLRLKNGHNHIVFLNNGIAKVL